MTVAIMNADEVLGREIVEVLNQIQPDWIDELRLFGSVDANYILYRGKEIPVRAYSQDGFDGTDIAIMGTEREVDAGAVVVRTVTREDADLDAPVIVLDINADEVDEHRGQLLVPSADAYVLAQLLHQLGETVGQVNGCILQPASVLGPDAIEELYAQTLALFNQNACPTQTIGGRLAFNLLPGRSELYGLAKFTQSHVSLNAMLVPVFGGTTMVLSIDGIQARDAEELLIKSPLFEVIEDAQPSEVVGNNSIAATNIHGEQELRLTLVFDELRTTAGALVKVAGEVFSKDAF